jgi:hypothetical protein
MSGVKKALRHMIRLVAGAVAGGVLMHLGLPALGAVVFVAVLVMVVAYWTARSIISTARWIIGDGDHSERVTQMIRAWRGDTDCSASVLPVSPRSSSWFHLLRHGLRGLARRRRQR